MRWIVFAVLSAVLLPQSDAQARSSGGSSRVAGHVRRDGTYVQPHQRTHPNQTERDNWSSKPNINPYTGKEGTREPRK